MKNLKIFALSALSLFGFAACQQVEIAPDVTPEATHTVTFVAGAPETKTTVDISDGETAKFAWTAEDVDRFTMYENGTPASKTTGVLGNDKMTIKATFGGSTAPGNASYVAVVNKSNDGQIMSAEAYDEDADILVSRAVSSFDGENGVQLQFKREVAIAKMTLKGLDAGEVVNHITVSSTANIAGSYGVDGWSSTKGSLDIYSALAMGVAKGYSIVANNAGEAVVWFTCIPQDATTLTVKVVAADGDIYTKTFSKPISLTCGDVKAFGVAMTKKPWVPVELANIDETMPLVITMATNTNTYALSLTGTDGNALGTEKAPKAIKVSLTDGNLSEKPGSDILWNIENNNGNLTIYPNGVTNKWLYTTNSNDGVRLGTNNENGYVWSIDATSGYLKTNANPSTVRYLGVYVSKPDWRAYDNTTGNTAGQTLRFYSNASPNPTTPKLSVTPISKTWESEETDVAVFTVTTNTAGVKDWLVSPTTLDWAKLDVDKANGTITVTPKDANTTKNAREATLTVTHAANNNLSKKITLTQKAAGAPASITIDSSTKNFPDSYGKANTFSEYTLNGLKYMIQQVYVKGTKLQWRASGNDSGTGTMYNSEKMPAGIASIVITFNSSDSKKNHTVKIGNSANPTSGTSITPTKKGSVYTYTCDGSSKYFVITNGSGAGYIDSIVINFE